MFFKKKGLLTDKQLQQISLSAIYTKQQNADFYSLAPGLGRSAKYFLNGGWGITDMASAKQVIESLIAEDRFGGVPEEQLEFEEAYIEAYGEAYAIKELLDVGVVSDLEELRKLGTKAWDLGRAVFVARVCFERRFLSETEVWGYLVKAYAQAVQNFDSWEGFARSYIIGRSFWSVGTDASDTLGFYNVYKWLCKDPTSPWIKVTLK